MIEAKITLRLLIVRSEIGDGVYSVPSSFQASLLYCSIVDSAFGVSVYVGCTSGGALHCLFIDVRAKFVILLIFSTCATVATEFPVSKIFSSR